MNQLIVTTWIGFVRYTSQIINQIVDTELCMSLTRYRNEDKGKPGK